MNEVFNYAKCPVCGNVIEDISGNTTPLRCCGKPMEILKPNTTEAATEKHLPVVEVSDGEILVKVGSVAHPMTKEHYIMWVSQVCGNKENKVILYPEQDPVVRFPYMPECKIYAYCNLHGLWMTEVKL